MRLIYPVIILLALGIVIHTSGCQNRQLKTLELVTQEIEKRRAAHTESMQLYQKGYEAYVNSNENQAEKYLKKAVSINDQNAHAISMRLK